MRLHEQVAALHREITEQVCTAADGMEALRDLQAYLLSPKFLEDPTVQVRDILARLTPVQDALLSIVSR